MGGIAALYILWLSTWLVIGSDAFGPAHYNWDQTLIAALAAIAAFKGRVADGQAVPAVPGHDWHRPRAAGRVVGHLQCE